jgi:hypothetical protein
MGPDCTCAIVRTLLHSEQGSNTTGTLGATKMKLGPVFPRPSLAPLSLLPSLFVACAHEDGRECMHANMRTNTRLPTHACTRTRTRTRAQ